MKERTLNSILKSIKEGSWAAQVNAVRNATDEYLKSELKKELPAFTPSGYFEVRKDEAIKDYLKVIHLDYDGVDSRTFTLEEYTELRKAVDNCPYTYASFESPSGGKLKAFIQVDSEAEFHELAWRQVDEYYTKLTGFKSDPSVKNISRLCFVSYDPNTYLNEQAHIFEVVKEQNNEVHTSSVSVSLKSPEEVWENSLNHSPTGDFVKGNRNNFMYSNACSASKWGISKEETINHALKFEQYDFSKKEIIDSIDSAYKNTAHEFGDLSSKKLGQYTFSSTYKMEGLPNFQTSISEEKLIDSSPLIPNHVYENLPEPLKEAASHFEGRKRDIFLLGTIVSLSGAIKNISGLYNSDKVFANSYLFFAAPPSSGKGVLKFVDKLIGEIELPVSGYQNDMSGFEPRFILPADVTDSSLIKHLEANDGAGVIIETESKTLRKAMESTYGSMLESSYLKAFQNETIRKSRSTDNIQIEIEEPKFSIAITGVEQDLKWLLQNRDSGFLSRWGIYNFNERENFKNPFKNKQLNLSEQMISYGKEISQRINEAPLNQQFQLSEKQENLLYQLWSQEYNTSNEELIAFIKRGGLSHFKYAMTLSAIRGSSEEVLICKDVDFQIAQSIVYDTLYKHIKTLVSASKTIQGSASRGSGENSVEYLLQRGLLPTEFKRDAFEKLCKENNVSLSSRQLSSHLKTAIDKGLLISIQHGVYRLT